MPGRSSVGWIEVSSGVVTELRRLIAVLYKQHNTHLDIFYMCFVYYLFRPWIICTGNKCYAEFTVCFVASSTSV